MDSPIELDHHSGILILLISGSCCSPQMYSVDEQARRVIDRALAETGATARVQTLMISSALRGEIPAEILQEIGISADLSIIQRLPAILINGKLLAFGVPELDAVKSTLLQILAGARPT